MKKNTCCEIDFRAAQVNAYPSLKEYYYYYEVVENVQIITNPVIYVKPPLTRIDMSVERDGKGWALSIGGRLYKFSKWSFVEEKLREQGFKPSLKEIFSDK